MRIKASLLVPVLGAMAISMHPGACLADEKVDKNSLGAAAGAYADQSSDRKMSKEEKKLKDSKQAARAKQWQPEPNVTQEEYDEQLEMPEIKGIHPVKRALRPLEEVQLKVVRLQDQVMELQKPLTQLHPAMLTLQDGSENVDKNLEEMQAQMDEIHTKVNGVREDLAKMQAAIASLRKPVRELKGPMEAVATPMLAVQSELNWIIGAVIMSGIAVIVGTPLIGFLLFVNRNRLFPVSTKA